MAAISFTASSGRYQILWAAQGGTKTDWLAVPHWARLAIVHLDITTAGTNTILTLKAASPTTLDDTRVITFLTSATITAATYHQYVIGDVGATAVADSATVSTMVTLATALPAILGVTVTPSTSTYTSAIEFRGGRA